MWKSPRLILVFWLSGLWALVCVISQFITVVTYNFNCVLFFLCSSFFILNLGCVVSGGRGNGIPKFPEVPFVLILLFLLVLPGFIGRLGLRGRSGVLRSLGILPAIHRFLGLNFVYSGMSESTSSEDLYISFLYIGTQS